MENILIGTCNPTGENSEFQRIINLRGQKIPRRKTTIKILNLVDRKMFELTSLKE